MSEFLQGFIAGVKETPKAFFAPEVAMWRLLVAAVRYLASTTESLRPARRKI